MLLVGKLTIDPSQVAEIVKIKPTKVFGKIFNRLTMGAISDKEEQETFTALSILQSINKSLISCGVTDVIRLSHDDIDFYLDEKGQKDDLKLAMDKYDMKLDSSMDRFYKTLLLICEHDDKYFKYLIEIEINKNHKVGVHPIEMTITGALKEFKAENGNISNEKIKKIFHDQQSYSNFKFQMENEFETFLDNMSFSIKKYLKVTEINQDFNSQILVPKSKQNKNPNIYQNKDDYGVYYGYYGFDDFLFYNLLWSDMCHQHHITIDHTQLVNEEGNVIGNIDDESVDTGVNDISSEESYSPVDAINSSAGSSSGFSGGGWFGDTFGEDSTSSDSSCSSCSSCGGD